MNHKPPIEELEIVLSDTTALVIHETAKAELVAKLKEVAERIPGAVNFAETLTVGCATDADKAAGMRELMIGSSAEADKLLREFDGKLIERLFRTHRAWTALISRLTTPFDQAAKVVKSKIIAWQQAEQEKAEAEQRRLQAEADEKARRERERLEKQAARLKTPELQEQRLEQAAQIVAPVIQVAVPKAAVKMQKRWQASITDKATFLKAAATDSNLHGFIDINLNAMNRSKAANSTLELPGITFKQITV